MAIPVMLAAGIIGIIDMLKIQDLNHFLPIMITGFLTSAVVGYLAISWLIEYMRNHSLLAFAAYCLFLGAGSLAFIYFNPQAGINDVSATSAASTEAENNAYQVGLDPDLEWLIPSMNNCKQESGDIAVPLPAIRQHGKHECHFRCIYHLWNTQSVV